MTNPDTTTESTARAEPPQAPFAAAGPARTGGRLAWLDVLRGLAALAVVFNHFGYFVPPGLKGAVYQWINPGDYGVFVFFIISGYIVPASLERKGSVRTFWVSRLFRLYPLYLLAVAIAVVLYMVHVGGLRGEGSDLETSVLSQMLMMSNVLAGQNLPNVVWSLSYEMIFYLLLTALFMARVLTAPAAPNRPRYGILVSWLHRRPTRPRPLRSRPRCRRRATPVRPTGSAWSASAISAGHRWPRPCCAPR